MKAKGFTLLELIVAISIFALISAMTYPSMIQILNLGEQADTQTARLAEIQKAMTIVARDVRQIVNRPVRDSFGSDVEAVVGGTGTSTILQFTRSGWRNPAKVSRPNIQRIAYELSEGNLFRHSWYVLDRSSDTTNYEQLLLEEVDSIEIRFLDDQKEWQEFWPPADKTKPRVPMAIEVVVELEDWGRINRILRVTQS